MELINLDSYLESKDLKLNNFNKEPIAITIGVFDGFHLAHKALLDKLIEVGKEKHLKTGAITFSLHPDFVLNKRINDGYLLSFDERVKKFSESGIDFLFVFTFSEEFSKISPSKFEEILLGLNVTTLVLGKDTKYGYLGRGDINSLKKRFNVIEFSDYYLDGNLIHSEYIRKLLKSGEIEKANQALGYNFYIKGIVSRGRQIGRTYNVKTANIDLMDQYNYLVNGVYGVYVYLDGAKHLGICNIGNNPSFNYTEIKKLEVNIFDFDQDIYGKELTVELVTFIRREVVFNKKEELKEQIEKDTKKYLEYLGGTL